MKTSVQCDCKSCDGKDCCCMCHPHNLQSSAARTLNVLGAMVETGNQAEAMSNKELTDFLCNNFGTDERIDSMKSAVISEIQHRLNNCTCRRKEQTA